MAFATLTYSSLDGATDQFDVTFPYISASDVKVFLNGSATTAFSFLTTSRIQMNSMPASGSTLIVKRATSQTSRLVDYQTGGILSEDVLDTDSLQAFYMAQEAIDVTDATIQIDNATAQWTSENLRITNLATPTSAQDAVTKAYTDAITDAVAASAVTAADSASSASSSASAASGSATTASSSASSASTSASEAAASAASVSPATLVAKTSTTGSAGIPVGTTAQRDGSPATGYFRYNSTETQFEGYDGSAWGQIGGGAGYFKGDNGTVGSSPGDIFRINEAELNTNVTITSAENASATGPVGVASGVTLTVEGVLVII